MLQWSCSVVMGSPLEKRKPSALSGLRGLSLRASTAGANRDCDQTGGDTIVGVAPAVRVWRVKLQADAVCARRLSHDDVHRGKGSIGGQCCECLYYSFGCRPSDHPTVSSYECMEGSCRHMAKDRHRYVGNKAGTYPAWPLGCIGGA